MSKEKDIIVIVGPTASGKSDVANELGFRIYGEVVSSDSMQIYKGMDIGTGKILPSVQKVKHWGLDIVNANDPYSAALFQKYSRNCFKDIISRDKIPILCGGTGFYVRAAIDDYDFPKGEQENNPVRDKYKKYLEDHGADELWNLLFSRDPKSAEIIHKNNAVRVIRALEIFDEGKSYFEQVENLQNLPQKVNAKFFGLSVDPEILKTRINNRVDKMMSNGLVEEVKNLLDNNYREALCATSAIGYKEIVSYLDGKIGLDEAIEQIKTSTRQYAKRQRTWFKKDSRIHWIDFNNMDIDSAVKEIILCYDKGQ